jgi:predicted ATPase
VVSVTVEPHSESNTTMRDGMTPETLCGRDTEIAVLDEWLRDIGDGGRALLIHGEAGIGKTSILDAAVSAARTRGCGVLAVTGVESEAHLAFAGLHQLLRPVLGRADELPPPQRKALLTAFGVLDGDPPVLFLVGLATLNLLADIAAVKPLLLVADDVQWLDTPTAEVLAFVGRRLGSDRILLLAAMRDGFRSPLVAAKLPERVIEPLSEDQSAELLDAHAPELTGVALSRILDQAAGNPLALVELPRALSSSARRSSSWRLRVVGARPTPRWPRCWPAIPTGEPGTMLPRSWARTRMPPRSSRPRPGGPRVGGRR